ncbi:MAG: M1 family peptidase, partial [Bacteroidetes bacterium]|jgi:aminopeptidase N|nr:M1 family peptidase [Bacteroidota bacterium]
VVYEKGASVLYLLRQTVGDSVFAEVLRETIRRHADRPLSTEAFQAVAEEVSGLDLERWFDVWVYGRDLPTLRAEWQAAKRTLRWFVEGDGGTLDGVPVPLRIQQGGRGYDASVVDGQIVLPGEEMPEISPVGMMLDVQVRAAED